MKTLYEFETTKQEIYFKDYYDFISECAEKNYKLLYGLTKNLPNTHNFVLKVFYRNGVVNHYTSWTQISTVVFDCFVDGVEINTQKMINDFLKSFPNWENQKIVVEYLKPMVTSVQRYINKKENPTSVQRYIDSLNKTVVVEKPSVCFEEVMKKRNSLPAKEFKLWLRKYLAEAGVVMEVKMSTGVDKIVQSLKKLLT